MICGNSRVLVENLERWRSAQERRGVLVRLSGRGVQDGGLETGSRAGGDREDRDAEVLFGSNEDAEDQE